MGSRGQGCRKTKVDLRRQLFNSKFLVRLMKYRMHKKRVLRATQRIKIACKFFNAKRDAAMARRRVSGRAAAAASGRAVPPRRRV